jgi:hypothetical protein
MVNVRVPTKYEDVTACTRAAKANMGKVQKLLSQPTIEGAEQCATILREVEIQLGCAAAILKTNGTAMRDAETRSLLESLQQDVAVLAQFFAEADKLFSGWLLAIRTKRAGYTDQGQAAPLVLVNKVSWKG